MDCRSPSEASLLPPSTLQPTDVRDYWEELVLSLSAARSNASLCIQKAQKRYKKQYGHTSSERPFKVGQWILIKFSREETGKLSRPWHGPYRIISVDQPNVSASKVYFPDEKSIQVHQSRVCPCPLRFPAGYYWYGGRRQGAWSPLSGINNLRLLMPL